MVLIKTKETRAGKRPGKKDPLGQNIPKTHYRVEVQTWYPCFDNVYKLRDGKCDYKKNVSYNNFRFYRS